MDTMTPDQFFDALDELFGTDDGYVNHLKRIKELQEHYDNSIHTDWIAEAAGEDAEDYRNVCCADTLGKMIKENKKLKGAQR